ncbi:MAG TPA: DUF3151 domain-containing protein [Microlunatus sp.]
MTEPTHRNLLAQEAGVSQTLLPTDPAAAALASATAEQRVEIVSAHPTSSLGWALLAEQSLAVDAPADTLMAYAYARTGYHRGLDALRRAGWRGSGPVPWEHEANRGFLRALWALSVAAGRIGETEEQERCSQFLRDSSETAYAELTR